MVKITTEERIESLADFKEQIRLLDPDLSNTEVERRAVVAAGLESNGRKQGTPKLKDVPKGGLPHRAIKATGKAPEQIIARVPMNTNKAQRIIFGVMLGVTILTIIGDITSEKAKATDSIARRMVAGTLAGIMLMLLAIPLPKVAASLAGVAAVTVLFVNPSGATIIAKISGTSGAIGTSGGGVGQGTVK
jgi:hypothetical protein